MNLITKKLFTTSLLLVAAVGIVFSQPTTINDPTQVAAAPLTFTINASRFPTLTGSKSTAEKNGVVSVGGIEVELGVKNMSTPDNIELTTTKDASAIYNITALPGKITSITIKQTSGQTNILHLGDSSRIINSVTANYTPIPGTSDDQETVSSRDQTFNSTDIPLISTLNFNFFALLPTGNTGITEITFLMNVEDVVVANAKTFNFAADFLAQTDNKFNLCTDAGLKWSFSSVSPAETSSTETPVTLEGQYAKLSGSEQTAFKTDTTDTQIVLARQRYIYLRTVTPSLFNFADI
jgi:hypothetical protein